MFKVGDSVRVFQGDYTGAYGVIEAINETLETCTLKRGMATYLNIKLSDLEAN